MGEVVKFQGYTNLDIPPERVLEGAVGAGLKTVLVLGTEEDGELYAASSTTDKAFILFLIEKFKFKLLNGDYGGIAN